MKKKSVAIIFLAVTALILTLSVASAVLAEDSREGKGKTGPAIATARVQAAMMHRMVKADENFKVRPLAENKIKQMDDLFEKLKENETSIKNDFKEKQRRFNETLIKLRACNSTSNATANDSASKECSNIRSEAVERSKEAALNQIDLILNHLEKLKQKLQSSQNMPQDELTQRIASIDSLVFEVGKIKITIQSATTKAQINAALVQLKRLLGKIRMSSDTHSQGLLRAEIMGVFQRSEVIQKKLECALSGLKVNGTDTTALDQKLAQLNSTMAQAKDLLLKAKTLLASNNATQVAMGKADVRQARDLVQHANSLVQEIKQIIVRLGGRPCQEKQEIEVDEPEPATTTNT